jgi:predicted DNA-binding transcriptional regulator AlpA
MINAIADEIMARLKPIVTILQMSFPPGNDSKVVSGLGKQLESVDPISKGEQQQDLQRSLPQEGYLRLKEVLALIPVSKSTWWEGVRKGRFPKPTKKFGPRIAAWDVRDIRALLEDNATE